MNKRVFKGLAVGLVMTLGLAACGSDSASTDTIAAADDTIAAAEPLAGAGLTVGLLYDITGRGDKSFNDAAAAGYDQAVAEFPGATFIESAPTGDEDRAERLQTMIDQGAGLIVCVGFLWTKDCSAGALAHPEISFAIIDDVIDSPNAVSLLFKEAEGSFLVGYAAALKSTSGKLGFIGGVRTDGIGKFEAGFKAGVAAANPDATVEVKYATEPPDFSGFNDPAKGKSIATAMYSSGIDVVYHAAGGTGAGLFTAALESGKKPGEIWAIGVDSDQYQSVATENGKDYILTSMLKRVDVATYGAMKAYLTGSPLSGTMIFDLSKDGVGYSASNSAIADIADKLEAVKAEIVSGAITVPEKP